MRRELRVLIGVALVLAGAYSIVSVLVLNAREATVITVVLTAFLGVGAIGVGVALMRKRPIIYHTATGGR
jgi:hypothetical protein